MKYLFNVLQGETKKLAGPWTDPDKRDAYGMMAEQEPDPQKWVGKLEIDVSGEVPSLRYREVISGE